MLQIWLETTRKQYSLLKQKSQQTGPQIKKSISSYFDPNNHVLRNMVENISY